MWDRHLKIKAKKYIKCETDNLQVYSQCKETGDITVQHECT